MSGVSGILFLSENHYPNFKFGPMDGSNIYTELLKLKLLLRIVIEEGVEDL
jgi:hypothetical protein